MLLPRLLERLESCLSVSEDWLLVVLGFLVCQGVLLLHVAMRMAVLSELLTVPCYMA